MSMMVTNVRKKNAAQLIRGSTKAALSDKGGRVSVVTGIIRDTCRSLLTMTCFASRLNKNLNIFNISFHTLKGPGGPAMDTLEDSVANRMSIV
jgi:hypothetical protein